MKRIFVIFILLTVSVFGQNTYTSNYWFTKIAAGTLNYADTANHNWTRVDSVIKSHWTIADSIRADLYTEHEYDGKHKSEVITWDNLATTAKSNMVQTSGNQNIAGLKTFIGGIGFGTSSRFLLGTYDTYNAQGELYRTGTPGADLITFFYGAGASYKDTIATHRYIRNNLASLANFVDLTSSQNIGGTKLITGKLGFSGAGILQIPTEIYTETQYALCGNSDMMFYYYSKYDYDSLLSYRLLRNYLNGYMTNSITPYTNDVYSLGTSTKRFRSIYGNYIVADTFVVSKIFSPIADTMEIVSGVLKINGQRLASYSTEGGLQLGEREKTLGAVYTDSLISDASLQISALGTGGNGVIELEAEAIYVNGQFHKEVQNVTITTTTFPTVTKSLVHMESDVNVTISTIPEPPVNKEGFILTIVMTGGAGFVTLSDNVDNLRLAGDFDMGLTDAISLMWYTGGEYWIEISRSNNN